jgi:two-component system CitB family response regulator
VIQVLIIEDDLRIAEINKRFTMKVEGFEVTGIATDGSQAKDLLEILTPDLVLLDLHIPGIQGLELLKYIKLHHSRTDVIMITAAKDLNTVRDSIHSGVFDYIVKPVVFDRIKETLEKFKSFWQQISALEVAGSQLIVDQQKIDELLRKNTVDRSYGTILPKGIDTLTLQKVTQHINNLSDSFTADQISIGLGISRSTSRRYLEYLVSEGVVIADLNYGTVGRPERVYRTIRS